MTDLELLNRMKLAHTLRDMKDKDALADGYADVLLRLPHRALREHLATLSTAEAGAVEEFCQEQPEALIPRRWSLSTWLLTAFYAAFYFGIGALLLHAVFTGGLL